MEFVARHLALLLTLHLKAFPEQYDSSKMSNSSNAPVKSLKMKRARKTPFASWACIQQASCNIQYQQDSIQKGIIGYSQLSSLHAKSQPTEALPHDNGFNCLSYFHFYTMCIKINHVVNRENALACQHQTAAATKHSGAGKGKWWCQGRAGN